MKKMISVLTAQVMALSMVSPVLAELQIGEINPKVYVNDREISFKEQLPVIDVSVNRTLVPLRGVFEAMGSEVIWNGEKRTVTINSKDNLTRLVLEIGNPVMKVYNAVSLMKYDEAEYELETAPIIMNDRTLIPLRAISENMAADVDFEDYVVTIKSKEYKKYIANNTEAGKADDEDYVYSLKDNLLNVSISADKEEAEAGDEVVVYVNMTNTDKVGEAGLSGVTATVYYDDEKFSFEKAEIMINGEVETNILGASNGEFFNDSVKTVMIVMPSADKEIIPITDSAVAKITFKSINGEEGEFRLSDRKTHIGYDTGLLLETDAGNKMYEDYTELYIDTTPVVVK